MSDQVNKLYNENQGRALTDSGRAAMMEMLRRTMPTTIAAELNAVQPLSDVIWDSERLGRAYAAVCSMHDREPLLSPGTRPDRS